MNREFKRIFRKKNDKFLIDKIIKTRRRKMDDRVDFPRIFSSFFVEALELENVKNNFTK